MNYKVHKLCRMATVPALKWLVYVIIAVVVFTDDDSQRMLTVHNIFLEMLSQPQKALFFTKFLSIME